MCLLYLVAQKNLTAMLIANPFFYASLFWAKNIADYLCKANDQEKEIHLWTSLNECPFPIV